MDTYVLITSLELTVPGDTERSEGKYVFKDTVDPPLRFQDGDILGIFQPNRQRRHVRLISLPGATSSLSYYVPTDTGTLEPHINTFTTTDDTVLSENSQPLLAIEISEFPR